MKVKLVDVTESIFAGGDVPRDRFSEVKNDKYKIPIYANAEKDDGLYGYTDMARVLVPCVTVAARGTIGFTVKRIEPFLPVVRLITVIPNKEKITLDYLYYALRNCKPKSSGTSIPQLTVPDIKNYSFEIASISRQEEITHNLGKVELLMEMQKKQIKAYDLLIKSRFMEMFGDPVHNSLGWTIKKLGDLSIQINSGNTPKGGEQVYVDKGITFFRSQNVWKDRLEMDDIAYIDEVTHASMSRSSLKHGDILMTKTGRINTENSSLGRAALYMGEDDEANVNGHVYFIRLKPEVNNKFVLRILVSDEYRDYIRSVCVGGIDKRQLNKNHIEDFPIICPPEDLIKEYIQFVDQVDELKTEEQRKLEKAQTLFDSLMQKYFG